MRKPRAPGPSRAESSFGRAVSTRSCAPVRRTGRATDQAGGAFRPRFFPPASPSSDVRSSAWPTLSQVIRLRIRALRRSIPGEGKAGWWISNGLSRAGRTRACCQGSTTGCSMTARWSLASTKTWIRARTRGRDTRPRYGSLTRKARSWCVPRSGSGGSLASPSALSSLHRVTELGRRSASGLTLAL